MAKMIDNICKLRDILEYKQDNKLVYSRGLIKSIFQELHRHIKRRTQDPTYETDFMSQDLRELAASIRATLKRWDDVLNPDENIKALKKTIVNRKLDLNAYCEKAMKYCIYRSDNVQHLTELLNLCEYYSVYLYFLEEAQMMSLLLNIQTDFKGETND